MIRKFIYFVGAVVIFIGLVKILLIAVALAFGLSNCSRNMVDNCVPGMQKCDGTIRLICNNQKNWEADFCWDNRNQVCCEVGGFAYCSMECK